MSRKKTRKQKESELTAVIVTNLVFPGCAEAFSASVYEDGLAHMRWPGDGKAYARQFPDAESAIEAIPKDWTAMAMEMSPHSCRSPRIEVHRVPANCSGFEAIRDWLRSIADELQVRWGGSVEVEVG